MAIDLLNYSRVLLDMALELISLQGSARLTPLPQSRDEDPLDTSWYCVVRNCSETMNCGTPLCHPRMRRFSALSMLIVLLISWATPNIGALGPKSEGNLPACCRRNGKHHCMMSMAERSQIADRAPAFSTPPERCPHFPAIELGVQGNFFVAPTPESALLPYSAMPVMLAQLLPIFAKPAENAHLKRGPPALLL